MTDINRSTPPYGQTVGTTAEELQTLRATLREINEMIHPESRKFSDGFRRLEATLADIPVFDSQDLQAHFEIVLRTCADVSESNAKREELFDVISSFLVAISAEIERNDEEEARRAEEARKAEEARQAEEARKAENIQAIREMFNLLSQLPDDLLAEIANAIDTNKSSKAPTEE